MNDAVAVFAAVFAMLMGAWLWSVILHLVIGEKFKCCFACAMRSLPAYVIFYMTARALPRITDPDIQNKMRTMLDLMKERLEKA